MAGCGLAWSIVPATGRRLGGVVSSPPKARIGLLILPSLPFLSSDQAAAASTGA